MKAFALLVGPNGVGLFALMQSVVNLGVIVASFGIATSVIGGVAEASGSEDPARTPTVERAAMTIGVAGGLAGAVLLVAFREPISQLAMRSPARSSDVVLLAGAVLLTVLAVIEMGILAGHHRVRAVAAVSVGTGVTAAASGIALVALLGVGGFAPALLIVAAIQFLLARIALARRRAKEEVVAVAGQRHARRQLLRLGLPVAGSQLVSTGATFVVPFIVLQVTQASDVGLFRAAAAISAGYLTFFLAALTQDYLPRIAAAHDEVAIAVLVERRMRLVLGLGVPVILGLLAVGPWLIEFLYSTDFAPAFEVLKWQLVGDLVRLPAWVLAFVLLARRTGMTYFGIEAASGAALLIGATVGLELVGLQGVGIAYAISQAIYYVTVWAFVRRAVPTVPGRLQAVVVAVAIGTALLLSLDVGLALQSAILGGATLALAGVAWPRMYRLQRVGEL